MRALPLLFLLVCATSGLAAQPKKGELVDGVAVASDPAHTYAVYLPSKLDPAKRYPLLLIFDPRSRGAMAAEIFREAAEKREWILVSSNDTRSDGPWDPNVRAVNAIWPEAMRRFPVDPSRVYAAGFSGGAMLALVVAEQSGRIAGVISVGGRLPEGLSLDRAAFAHYGAAGRRDFNALEMRAIDAALMSGSAPHRLELFDGRHQWFDPSMAAEAIDWMEILAVRAGTRAGDPALIAEALQREMKRAAQAEQEGRLLEAVSRYRSIASAFDGLAKVDMVFDRMRTLAASKDAKRQSKDAKRWAGWEQRQTAGFPRILARVVSGGGTVSSRTLLSDLRIGPLLKQAAGSGEEADAAARVLGTIYAQTSFYLPAEMEKAKRWAEAILFLEVARAIEGTWPVEVRLATNHARLGNVPAALDHLERAVEAGLRDPAVLREEAFAALRDEGRFKAVEARLAR